MKKSIIIFSFFIQNIVFAGLSDTDLASIYADHLISEFDKQLELSESFDLRDSEVYAKLISARSFIENQGGHGHHMPRKNKSLLEITNPNQYISVINQIDSDSKEIFKRMQKNVNRERSLGVIYPSSGRAGNVTGNTFPAKVWSLTFDDGPRGSRTKTIVDNLYERGIKASFFMLTREAKRYTSTVDYVKDAGMEIALHSYNHKNLNKASDQTIHYEVGQALLDLKKLAKDDVELFRLPYGSGLRNSNLRQIIANYNLIHIFWNVDTLDWKDKDPQSIFRRVKLQMSKSPKNSGVILFHDIHAQTVIASELTMDYLIDNGHKVCTTGDVIKYLNGKKQNCLK